MIDTTNLRKGPIPLDVDVEGLRASLRATLRGETRFDRSSRALYSTDASNYRQVPIGVVLPLDAQDAIDALALCRRFGAPIVSRGGGTSLAGQCCNVAVVFDFSKYVHRVVSIDPGRRLAVVQPGTILDDLRAAAAKHGLTFGPDPASHDHCTLGGMIGNDSCGVHSVMAATFGEGPRTADQVCELDIVTYDGVRLRVGKTSEQELAAIIAQGGRRGQIYRDLKTLADSYAARIRQRYPDIPRRVSGYNLPYLLPEEGFHVARALVGSEGTCVTVLEATVRLISSPRARSLVVAGFESVFVAADLVMEVLKHKPIGLEGMDDRLINDMKSAGLYPTGADLLPEGKGWLIIEFGGDSDEQARAIAREAIEDLMLLGALDTRTYDDEQEQARVWKVRESGLAATAHVPRKRLRWEGWEDSAVPPEKLGAYLRDLRELLEKHGYEGDFYGHFGQGCLHTRTDFELETLAGIEKYRAFLEEAADLVVSYGGSLSGEHGDGQARAELLPKMFGPELIEAFRQFKRIWDPDNRMNPGKVVDAYAITENLRLRAGDGAPSATHFRYPEDEGSFSRAVLRCVGVGKCRRLSGGTMCPSFLVTREEEHSTRGRARLLFEMQRTDTLREGWRSDEVLRGLDLCLSCKGCKKDCPVGVDMATYKAEFLSHYYRGRVRPRSAYALGLIARWSRLASRSPGLMNFFTQTPGVSSLARLAAGISPDRNIPAFAAQTFRAWFARRPTASALAARQRVLLWPDTFNDHFHPEIARAALEVLEAAGYRVSIPRRPLCCGRPLYDYGMLDLAKRVLREVLETLSDDLRDGVPVVVLEPSCAAVFRDELTALFPEDGDARRLKNQTLLLSEILVRQEADWAAGSLPGRAIIQTHCHQKALFGAAEQQQILSRIGLETAEPNDSCCGMAGAFGFERGHSDISRAIGERAILPAIRGAPPETLIIADGFSCREQIRQETSREALHLAQVLRLAALPGSKPPSGSARAVSRGPSQPS